MIRLVSSRLYRWRLRLQGVLLLPIAGLLAMAASAWAWPDLPVIGTLARMLDSAAPHLLGLSLPLLALLALLGLPRIALGGAVLGLAVAGGIAARHLALAAPPAPAAQAPELRVLWFNMLNTNPTPPAELIRALADSGADLVFLGEARALEGHLPALAESFPVQLGCSGRERCEVLALARDPAVRLAIRSLGGLRTERIVTADLTLPGGAPLTIAAMHLLKPWYFGYVEYDEWYARDTLGRISGPLVLLGDFNAAPWSRRILDLARECAMAPPRRPPASWPAIAGSFGVPIDLMLTRGGAQLHDLRPWAAGRGSNHRGLIAGVSTAVGAPPDAPTGCAPWQG